MTKGTEVVDIEAAIRAKVQAAASRTAPTGGNMIKLTKDKKFKMPDGEEREGPLSVVVLDFISANSYFDRPYRDGEVTPPACFAIGDNPKDMAPDESSPVKQSASCNGCPMNEFGSHPNGRGGKACQNKRLLAVKAPGDDPEAPIYLLAISPTGTKYWDAYVGLIKNRFNTAEFGVITEIYFDDKSDFQSLRFGNPAENPFIKEDFGRVGEARELLTVKPDVSGYTPLTPKKAGKR